MQDVNREVLLPLHARLEARRSEIVAVDGKVPVRPFEDRGTDENFVVLAQRRGAHSAADAVADEVALAAGQDDLAIAPAANRGANGGHPLARKTGEAGEIGLETPREDERKAAQVRSLFRHRHDQPAVAGELDDGIAEIERGEVRLDMADEREVEAVELLAGEREAELGRADQVDGKTKDVARLRLVSAGCARGILNEGMTVRRIHRGNAYHASVFRQSEMTQDVSIRTPITFSNKEWRATSHPATTSRTESTTES